MAERTGLFERFLDTVFRRWYVGLPFGVVSLAFGIYSFFGASEQAQAAENWFRAARAYVMPVCFTVLGCSFGFLGLGNLFGWFPQGDAATGSKDAEPGAAPDRRGT